VGNVNGVGSTWNTVYHAKGNGTFAGKDDAHFPHGGPGVSINQIINPSTTIDVVECRGNASGGATNYCHPGVGPATGNDCEVPFLADAPGTLGAGYANALFAGHKGHSNYLLADGHVASLRPSQTITPSCNMWTIDNSATGPSGQTNYNGIKTMLATTEAYFK
jgi:prepilin-type processing-associated H-X9-DG protein